MTRTKDHAVGLARELKLTEDGIRGTLEWVSERVPRDVYLKVETIAEQAVRYGIMKNVIEGWQFNSGIEKELEK